MTEKQTDLELKDAQKTSVKEDIKAKQKHKLDKNLHQENFKTKNGRELTVTFPGMEEAQDLIDEANSPQFYDQYLSDLRLHTLFLDKILEDNLTIDDFDKELRKNKRTIKVQNEDGSITEYELKFPNLGNFEQINEQQQRTRRSKDLNEFILQQVLTKPLTLGYFNTHEGYGQIITQAKQFLAEVYFKSEYKEVIDYINDFVNRMFR